MYFEYNEIEIEYLKKKDKKLALVIEKIGDIKRTINKDIFTTIIRSIVGQQISTKAQETVLKRLFKKIDNEIVLDKDSLDEKVVTPEDIKKLGKDELRLIGISDRKVEYIWDFTLKVCSGEFDIDELYEMEDSLVVEKLSSLKGIGVWTAEMVMIFSMQRKNIFSYNDLGIHRGLKMIYGHKNIDKKRFEIYRKRFSPYGSIASLYIWEVSSWK